MSSGLVACKFSAGQGGLARGLGIRMGGALGRIYRYVVESGCLRLFGVSYEARDD